MKITVNNYLKVFFSSVLLESFNTLVQNYNMGTSPANVLTISQVINDMPEEDDADDTRKSSHKSKVSKVGVFFSALQFLCAQCMKISFPLVFNSDSNLPIASCIENKLNFN